MVAPIIAISSMLSLGMLLSNEAVAAPDKFGIEKVYPNADGESAWFLNNEEPEEDENFLMTSQEDTELEEEEGEDGEEDSGVFQLDAETDTQKHGVRFMQILQTRTGRMWKRQVTLGLKREKTNLP